MRRNPITELTLPRVPAPDVGSPEYRAYKALTKNGGMPVEIARGLLQHVGWPTEVLGAGSFGLVYASHKYRNAVVKFTTDVSDGITSSYLMNLQDTKGPDPLPGMVHFYEVGRIDYIDTRRKYRGKQRTVYEITMERVIPLHRYDAEDIHVDEAEDLYQQVEAAAMALEDVWNDELRNARDLSLDNTTEEGLLPDYVETECLNAMNNYADSLIKKASSLIPDDWLTKKLLLDAARGVLFLAEHQVPQTDLHGGNWGVRTHGGDEPDLVMFDFGVSSVPATGNKYQNLRVMMRPGQRPKPRGQMELFER